MDRRFPLGQDAFITTPDSVPNRARMVQPPVYRSRSLMGKRRAMHFHRLAVWGLQTDEGDDLVVLMYWIGFLTIGSQVLLLREIFTCLYGSDFAFAFVMASWTFFSGLGAYLFGRALARRLPFRPSIGLVVYAGLVAAVFLLVRRWGSAELISFQDYLRIPGYLCLPCLLGGGLFSWAIAAARSEGGCADIARAYADETYGGLTAGILLTVYFSLGGLSVPALCVFFLASALNTVPSLRQRLTRLGLPVLAGVLLSMALLPVFRLLDRWTQELHYPGVQVIDHRNTPYGCVTAVRNGTEVSVYENGSPLPSSVPTPEKEAVIGVLSSLPDEWRSLLLLHGVSGGFGAALGNLYGCDVTVFEYDQAKLDFLSLWRPEALGTQAIQSALRVGASPLKLGMQDLDLVALFAAAPGSLQDNQELTLEFFGSLRRLLAVDGVVVVVLPMAPGYMHPLQRRYVSSVRAALTSVFPAVQLLESDLGCLFLVGRSRPTPCPPVRQRLLARLSVVAEDVVANVEKVFAPSITLGEQGQTEFRVAAANSALFPHGYFAYLHFHGRLIEGGSGLWNALFSQKPYWVPFALVLLLLLSSAGMETWQHGGASLFWCSWTTTMMVTFSIYVHQTIVGQAYGLVALLIAGSMTGIHFGARHTGTRTGRWQRSGVVVLLPAMFVGYTWLARLPHSSVLGLLIAANLCLGWSLGRQFADVSRSCPQGGNTAGKVFCIDLVGAAGGFLVGGVLLPWWLGFRTAAFICAGAALIAATFALRTREGPA